MAQPGFIFGGNTGISYDELQQRRKVLDAMLMRSSAPQNVGEGIYALAEGITGGLENRRLRLAETEGRKKSTDAFTSALSAIGSPTASTYTMDSPTAPGNTPIDPVAAASAMPSPTSPAGGARAAATGIPIGDDGDIYTSFIDTVRQGDPERGIAGVTNPYGLAAVAATGKAESGYSPGNVHRQWSDPSESGVPGMAGGIMSWRAERLDNMRKFAAANGGDPNRPSPQLQAQFFLNEDPSLVAKLNNAKSVEEAQGLMNRAWAFAGWDRPGGEAARRTATAQSYLPRFAGDQGAAPGAASAPVQVASNDPSIGMGSVPQPTPRPVETVAAAMPQQQAPAPSPAVQRVAQAMPQMPTMPNNNIPPEALAVLTDPYTTDGQKQAMQLALQQRAAGNEALYKRQMAQYEQQRDAILLEQKRQYEQQQLQEQREYDASVLADQRRYDAGLTDAKNSREDRRNETLDARDGRDFAFKVEQGNKPPSSVQEYEYYVGQERAAGREPLGVLEWSNSGKKAGADSTTITMGEGDKFYENLDRKNAERFATLSDGGQNARGRQAQVDQLDALLKQSPSGAEAAIKTWLGDLGIATDDLGPLQASVALIEKLVPEQREPGSGPLSDADIAGFRRSLPRAINQPGGNQLIIGRLKAINEYDIARGEIADMVADRAITPAEGRKQLRELKNPLEGYTELVRSLGADGGRGGTPVADTTPREGGVPVGASMGDQPAAAQIKSKADFDALPSGALYTAPDGSTRKKR